MSKKKRTKKGWLCPECKTVYAPRIKKCECIKAQQVGLKDVEIVEEYIPHVFDPLDYSDCSGLTISSTDWTKGISWYRMPPTDPNEPVCIYPNDYTARERD